MPLALCSMISLVASCSGDMFLLYYKQKLSYLLETATEEKVKDTKSVIGKKVNFLIDTLSFIISEGQYFFLFFAKTNDPHIWRVAHFKKKQTASGREYMRQELNPVSAASPVFQKWNVPFALQSSSINTY